MLLVFTFYPIQWETNGFEKASLLKAINFLSHIVGNKQSEEIVFFVASQAFLSHIVENKRQKPMRLLLLLPQGQAGLNILTIFMRHRFRIRTMLYMIMKYSNFLSEKIQRNSMKSSKKN